jgi:putative hydrolase
LGRLDVVVASVHSNLRMDSAQMTARMVRAVQSPHTDILGHCTGRKIVGRARPPSVFDADAVFGACATTGTAVEINSRPERRDPPGPLLEHALAMGCLGSIDTDAHAPGQLEWGHYGCEQAVAARTDRDRIVTTWSLSALLDWTAGHAA